MDELANRVIALEGPGFAGKTTLIKDLVESNSDDVQVIEEGSEYIDRDKNAVDFDFSNVNGALESLYFCVEVERKRCADLREKLRRGSVVVMDRSVLSNLVFYFVLAEFNSQFRNYFRSFFETVLAVYKSEVVNGSIVLPAKVLYIKPKNKSVFETRLGMREGHTDFLGKWESVGAYDLVYKKIFKHSYLSNNISCVDTDNTRQSVLECKTKLQELGKRNVSPVNTQKFFGEFGGEVWNISRLDLQNHELKYSEIRSRARSFLR